MDQPLAIWVLGIALSTIGVLATIILTRILKQSDEQANILGKQGMTLARIDATLHGENGLATEVRHLRERSHKQGDALHVVQGETTVLTIRVEKLEEIEERRVGEERRHRDRGTPDRRQA